MNEDLNKDYPAENGTGYNVEIFQLPHGWIALEKMPHPSFALANVRMLTIKKALPHFESLFGELRVYEALDPNWKRADKNPLQIGA
jgi:hypothetical protein